MIRNIALPVFVLLSVVAAGWCDEGNPVALRHWKDGVFTVETMWGLHIGFGVSSTDFDLGDRPLDFGSADAKPYSQTIIVRPVNQKEVEVKALADFSGDSANRVIVRVLANGDEADESNPVQRNAWPEIDVDGTSIRFLNEMDPELACKQLEAQAEAAASSKSPPEKNVSKLNVIVANDAKYTEAHCQRIAKSSQPAILIVNASVKKVGDADVEIISHNTIAFSKPDESSGKTRFVALGTEPYEMSKELSELFAKKEAAQKASRQMFSKLTVEQMNFKPENGTHTPRWNAEHMMGRELLFFSQIYNAVDPSIAVMDLNPKQMPKDYRFAHPDWTGMEEAQQMLRVEMFTRRFAYLLDGMELGKRAKGSRFWTPKSLLMQMERHYNEHSANVVKKMELDGWPAGDSSPKQ